MSKKTLSELAEAIEVAISTEWEGEVLSDLTEWRRLKKRLAKADKWRRIGRAAINSRAIAEQYVCTLKAELIELGAYTLDANGVFTRLAPALEPPTVQQAEQPDIQPAGHAPMQQAGYSAKLLAAVEAMRPFACPRCQDTPVIEVAFQPPFDETDNLHLRVLCRGCRLTQVVTEAELLQAWRPRASGGLRATSQRAQILRIGYVHEGADGLDLFGWEFDRWKRAVASQGDFTRYGWTFKELDYIARSGWIPMAWQKPQEGQKVLALVKDSAWPQPIPPYLEAANWCELNKVTHWQPFHAPEALEVRG